MAFRDWFQRKKKDGAVRWKKQNGKQGDEKKKSKSGKSAADFVAKVLSVVAAIVLWFYVMGVQSPIFEKTFTNLPISLDNLPDSNGLSVISGYGSTADIKLSGKKSDINKINPSDISVYVDMDNITQAGEVRLDVNVKAPNNSTIVDIQPSSLVVYVDRTITRSVPVKVNYTGGTTDKSLVIDSLTPASSNVSVTGPEEEVMKISHAQITLNLGLIDSSVEIRETLALIDENGYEVTNPYVRTSTSEMRVDVTVYRYATVPIELKFKGIIPLEDIEYTILPGTLEIKGNSDIIQAIATIPSEEIDETKINGSASYYVKLVIPSGVINLSDSDTVYAEIQLKNNVAREAAVDRIYLQNGSSAYHYELLTESLDVTIRGKAEILSAYHLDSIYGLVDLSGVKDTGTVMLPVSLRIPNGDGLYAYGTYYAEVQVTNAG